MYRLTSRSFHSVNSILSAPRPQNTVRSQGSSRLVSTDQELVVRETSGSVESSQLTTKTTPRRLYFKSMPFHRIKPNPQYHKIDLTLRLSVPGLFAKLEDLANVQTENPTTAKSGNSANAQDEHPTAEYGRKMDRIAWWSALALIGCATVYIHYLHATTPPL
jgi:hypothetical protein